MTIHQLKDPCWVLDPSPWGDDDNGVQHHATHAEAAKSLADVLEESGEEARKDLKAVQVKQEDTACWVAECDAPHGMSGTCGETLGDEEEGPSCIHFESLEELYGWAPGEGWTQVFADNALCRRHNPDNPAPPPSPAEQEAAGQMPLPGVA